MAAATNLFKDDITLLQEVVYFGTNVEWNQVQASVKRAEKTFIRPIFGDYYTDLLTKIGNDNLVAADSNLLAEMRLAAGNLTWWLYTPKHNVNISSTGFSQVNSDKARNASQWSVNDLKTSFRDAGFEGIENTFEFLEMNAEAYSYSTTAVFKAANGLFLASATDFQNEVDIMKSRYLYMQLIPEMKRIQRDVVQPILGKEAYDTLIKKLQQDNEADNELSADEKAWLEIIRPLMGYRSIADSLVKRAVNYHEHGMLVHNSSFSGSTTGLEPAAIERTDALQMEMDRLAKAKTEALDALVNPPEEEDTIVDTTNLLDPNSSLGGLF